MPQPLPVLESKSDTPDELPLYWLMVPWFFAAIWLVAIFQQKISLSRDKNSGDNLINKIEFEQQFTPVWGGADAERSLRELRAARLIPTRRLDVKATVEATARSGDYYQPVYHTRRIAPEHVLLVRSVHRHDQQAELAEELAARFKHLGLQIKVYRFRDDPRWLTHWDDKGVNAYFELNQIIARHGSARLLIISETDILFHPHSDEPRAWFAALSPWQDKVWLHPSDARKPHAKLLAEQDFLVLPLSRSSLPELVKHLTTVQPDKLTVSDSRAVELPDIILAEPDGWLSEYPPYGINLADLEWELENYLGAYGMRLLRAIAVYPKPHWKLTLALDYLLFGKLEKNDKNDSAASPDSPEHREQRLSRLSRLPWLMNGFMPNWLREHLLINSDADEREHVVAVWQSLFSQLSDNNRKSLQLDFSTPSKRQIKLLWNQLRLMPQSDAINDPIFAHILMGGKFGWFDFHLPRKLSERLPYAQRAMDLRPILGAVVGALLGMVVVFSIERHFAEPPFDPAHWQVIINHQSNTKALAELLQQRLQEDRFRVTQTDKSQPDIISDGVLKTNAILYSAGGESAAARIKQRLKGLVYGAEVNLYQAAGLDENTIYVHWGDLHGAAFNDELRMPEEPRLPFEPEMVRIPSGTFMMGSNDGDAEKPVRAVTIARPFAMSRTEITVGQFRQFVEDKAYVTTAEQGEGCLNWEESRYQSENNWKNPGFEQSDDHPVVCVSWDDAQSYVKWLSGKTGKQYRLPTEAEWEYAARAKSPTRYWWDDDIGNNNAVCDGCGSQWDNRQTAPVGSLKANAFGLHDTAGNVWEWVEDCWHRSYDNAPADGSAWVEDDGRTCGFRVIRGGSWGDNPRDLRSAYRDRFGTGGTSDLVGFRIARDF